MASLVVQLWSSKVAGPKAAQKRKKELLEDLRKNLKLNNGESTGDDSLESDYKNPHAGNTYAIKEKRQVFIGWLHEGNQVGSKTGGTRRMTVFKVAITRGLI